LRGEVKNPHTPKFNAEDVTKIVADTEGQYRVLCAVLAGTGLRIPQQAPRIPWLVRARVVAYSEVIVGSDLPRPDVRGRRQIPIIREWLLDRAANSK
jgi:hypothetical protein